MFTKLSSFIARLMVAALSAVPIAAQEPLMRTAVVEDRPVLLLPSGVSAFSGVSSLESVHIEVSTDRTLRTYRATYQGRTYTAYADVSGPPKRFAFDLAQRRFQVMASAVRVELFNYDDLDSLVFEQGAVSGKAYPELGFALIQLDPDTDPADVAELLHVDPRVRTANVQFQGPIRRPMVLPDKLPQSITPRNGAPVPANTKESLTSNLDLSLTEDVRSADFAFDVSVRNSGGQRSGATTILAALSTWDPSEGLRARGERISVRVPAIDAKGAPFENRLSFPIRSLDAGQTYYVLVWLIDGSEPGGEILTGTYTGFTLDSLKRVQHVCVESGRGSVNGVPDPLLPQQWHLRNTGQSAYVPVGGVAGEDLRMQDVLRNGPSGQGVKVAVVDTGMEICHPDLKASIEEGASFNFNASLIESQRSSSWAPRVEIMDPFNFDPTGGHGTSVAGLIAAQGGNGIGGRGVSPGVRLRGYNMLNAANQLSAILDSLGASSFFPNSTDVDVFNMSFGSSGSRPSNAGIIIERLFSHGVRRLRSGLGAIYVKAGGNGFERCRTLVRTINEEIGCVSSNGSGWNNLPYLIVVGAFNADGEKSSYSGAGSNLWVSAPGGEYRGIKPSVLTTDQMGWDRGLGVLRTGNPLDGEPAVNPDGDYTGRMSGTSSAAPNVSGAIAVLLEAVPRLTWRDVKHILAKTARRIDPRIEAVEASFGGNARTVRLAWTENAAGYGYHDWYGFGALDLDAALESARDHTPDSLGAFRQSGWFDGGSAAIPDNDGTGVTRRLQVSGLPEDADIEAVILEIDLAHAFPNDLGIHLVSPQGTRSVINQVFNDTLAVKGMDRLTWRLLSNAFYGENPNGDWQIEVFDAAEEDVGRLEAWSLRFYYGDHP